MSALPFAEAVATWAPILDKKWTGIGMGSFPSIKAFRFDEELTFTHASPAKPFFAYSQKTFLSVTNDKGITVRGPPMHEENGYIRFLANNKVEAVISQCTGLQETLVGSWMSTDNRSKVVLSLSSTSLARTPSAKKPYVTAVERVYTLDIADDILSYQINMATETNTTITKHLQNVLMP